MQFAGQVDELRKFPVEDARVVGTIGDVSDGNDKLVQAPMGLSDTPANFKQPGLQNTCTKFAILERNHIRNLHVLSLVRNRTCVSKLHLMWYLMKPLRQDACQERYTPGGNLPDKFLLVQGKQDLQNVHATGDQTMQLSNSPVEGTGTKFFKHDPVPF